MNGGFPESLAADTPGIDPELLALIHAFAI